MVKAVDFQVPLLSKSRQRKPATNIIYYILFPLPKGKLICFWRKKTSCSLTILKPISLHPDLCKARVCYRNHSFWVMQTSICAQLWGFFLCWLLFLTFTFGGTEATLLLINSIKIFRHQTLTMNLLHSWMYSSWLFQPPTQCHCQQAAETSSQEFTTEWSFQERGGMTLAIISNR